MSDLINPKDVVKAYQVIRDKGVREEAGYRYKGLLAENDVDGYTVFVNDGQVSMAVYYHYKYHLDYADTQQLERFKLKIDELLFEAE
ncbi:DUF3081 family protein [Marinagarivorans algicola]|uniref:DUF3081 family protein n=1 Tax=Marinagarivorans algicola TaxID=1513270 RepID=UPI0006B4AD53|nr:DUF3081 family protein [Marinagarivorans algicola]